jgi:hypothetical protein
MSQTKKVLPFIDTKSKPEEKKNSPPVKLKMVDSNFEKMEYDRFKKLLSEKIKDPKMAKKAALIISEMINKKN